MEISETKKYGSYLAELRTRRGLTQVEVAKRLGVPQSYVSKIENGERALKLYELFPYVDALDMTAEIVIKTK